MKESDHAEEDLPPRGDHRPKAPDVVEAIRIGECGYGDEGDRCPAPLSLHVADFAYKLE